MVQVWSSEGEVRRGVSARAEKEEGMAGVGKGKKYKNRAGKGQIFSWKKPTGGDGLERKKKRPRACLNLLSCVTTSLPKSVPVCNLQDV